METIDGFPDLFFGHAYDEAEWSKIFERLEDQLADFNADSLGIRKIEVGYWGFFFQFPDEKLAAGIAGRDIFGWCHIEAMWVHEILRRQGIGRLLLSRAEERARAARVQGIEVYTYSFQSPQFYRAAGFVEVGRVKNQPPPGHERVYFQKVL